MADNNEKKIKEALFKGTEEAADLKDQVWSNIEKEINKKEKISMKKNNKLKYGSIAAAILMVVLFTNVNYVNAAVDKIRSLFEQNKTIEQSLEGTTEPIEVELEVRENDYIIYIDKEYYHLETIDGKDMISPNTKDDSLPPVLMSIEKITDKSPSQIASETETLLKTKYSNVINHGKVDYPFESLLLTATSGDKWDSTVENYYFIDYKDGTYVITQQYFLEATEGHGERFNTMLKEFKIID